MKRIEKMRRHLPALLTPDGVGLAVAYGVFGMAMPDPFCLDFRSWG